MAGDGIVDSPKGAAPGFRAGRKGPRCGGGTGGIEKETRTKTSSGQVRWTIERRWMWASDAARNESRWTVGSSAEDYGVLWASVDAKGREV